MMKIYILADMEGVSGIRRIEQVQSDRPENAAGCRLMMEEINVAVAAALEAGAQEVIACDTHGGGGQVLVEQMDPRGIYETPRPGAMMPSLDESFSGVVLLGHHAMAGTADAFLDHTMSSQSWFQYTLNGQAMGEIGIEAAWAGHFNVPVIAVTGDEAAEAEARRLLGEIPCAAVKRAVGRNRARCLSVQAAHKRIAEAIGQAVERVGTFKPFKPELPATAELTLYRTDMADAWAGRRDVQRIGPRTLRAELSTLHDLPGF
jgi:D-amino peptidase